MRGQSRRDTSRPRSGRPPPGVPPLVIHSAEQRPANEGSLNFDSHSLRESVASSYNPTSSKNDFIPRALFQESGNESKNSFHRSTDPDPTRRITHEVPEANRYKRNNIFQSSPLRTAPLDPSYGMPNPVLTGTPRERTLQSKMLPNRYSSRDTSPYTARSEQPVQISAPPLSPQDLDSSVNVPGITNKVEDIHRERISALRQFYNQRFDNISHELQECLGQVEYDNMIGILRHSARNTAQIQDRINEIVQNALAAERELQIDQLSRDLTLLNGINQRLEDQISKNVGSHPPNKLMVSMKFRDLLNENENLRQRLRRERKRLESRSPPRSAVISPSRARIQSPNQTSRREIDSLKRHLGDIESEREVHLNELNKAKQRINELQNQIFLSDQRTEQAETRNETLRVQNNTLRERLKNAELEKSKGNSRVITMENELIDSFRKEKSNYQRQLDTLHNRLVQTSKNQQRIPQLEHALRIQKMEAEQEQLRLQNRQRENEESFKKLILDLEKNNVELKGMLQSREDEISKKRLELSRNAEDYQNQTHILRLEIKENYIPKDTHQKELDSCLREQRLRYQDEIKSIIERQKMEAQKMLDDCEQKYSLDHHHISAKMQSKDDELQNAINHRERLLESLEFEKKLVARLERDVENYERERKNVQTKYDELKKHYENKRSQLEHLKREINEGKHQLRGKDDDIMGLKKNYQLLENQMFAKTNEMNSKELMITELRVEIQKLRNQKDQLIQEKFAVVRENSEKLIQIKNEQQMAVNQAEERASQFLRDLQEKEHEIHSHMVRVTNLENELELYKQADIQLHAEIDKATKDSEYLAEKTAEQEGENLQLKNLLAIKQDQLQTLYYNFQKKKQQLRIQVARELENVRHSVHLGRTNVRHQLSFMQEQTMNYLKEQVNTLASLAQNIKERAKEEVRMAIDNEWRDKYQRMKDSMQQDLQELDVKLKVKNDELMIETRRLDEKVRSYKDEVMLLQREREELMRESALFRDTVRTHEENVAALNLRLEERNREIIDARQSSDNQMRDREREQRRELEKLRGQMQNEFTQFKLDKEQSLKDLQNELTKLKNQHEIERFEDQRTLQTDYERNVEQLMKKIKAKEIENEAQQEQLRELKEEGDKRAAETASMIKNLTENMKEERIDSQKQRTKLEEDIQELKMKNQELNAELDRKMDEMENLCLQKQDSRNDASRLNEKIFALQKEITQLRADLQYKDQKAIEDAKALNEILETGRRHHNERRVYGTDIDTTAKRNLSSERGGENHFVATLKDLELSNIPQRVLRSTTNMQDADKKFNFDRSGHQYTFQQQKANLSKNASLRTPTKSREGFKTHLSPAALE